MQAPAQRGKTRIFISHGAGRGLITDPDRDKGVLVDWFIVEPRDQPERLAQQVDSLRQAGRTVVELEVEPYTGLARKVL